MEEDPVGIRARRIITWRSVGLGLLLAVLIALVTPYNDYVVNNSFIVGSYFPPIVTIAVLAFVLLVNGPLHKFAPRLALSSAELAMVMAMGLIACSIPSQGLFRQVLPMPVAPFYFTDKADYHELFRNMHLPAWMWAVPNAEDGARDRVVTAFYARLLPGESIPWSAWLKPAIGWGSFSVAFLTALFSLACLLRFQWTVNERLAFPIAQLQGLLIAPPKPGRAFNDLFASRMFWIGLAFVCVLESSQVLKLYFPQTIPEIATSFDLKNVLAEQPWSYLPGWLKAQTIYFTLLGVSYFTTTPVSFSLWGTAVGMALLRWALDPTLTRLPDAAFADQQLGASFALMAGVLWIGRGHWAVIGRALIGTTRPSDARGSFVSYRVASILLIAGIAGMFTWLCIVGAKPWLAASIVGMILMAHVITARVVAETGLAFVRISVGLDQIFKSLPTTLLTPKDAFVYGATHYGYMQAARESELVFAMHGLNVINDAVDTPPPHRGTASVLGGTLVVTLVACFAASLWCYYGYATPLLPDDSGLLNRWGLRDWPQTWLVDLPTQVARGYYAPKAHNTWLQLMVGVGVMSFLQAMRWRFAAWPLLPVGYLAAFSFYSQTAWFSLFLGWLAKVLILRFGGAKLFNDLKPLFVGLIFGEAFTVGIWLIVTLVLALSGEPFHVVRFLPQ